MPGMLGPGGDELGVCTEPQPTTTAKSRVSERLHLDASDLSQT